MKRKNGSQKLEIVDLTLKEIEDKIIYKALSYLVYSCNRNVLDKKGFDYAIFLLKNKYPELKYKVMKSAFIKAGQYRYGTFDVLNTNTIFIILQRHLTGYRDEYQITKDHCH